MNSVNTETEQSSAQTDDEMLFKRRRHHGASELVTGLNLTAMMDVLTILLVYLIKVYADAPENITLNDDLRPPSSTAPQNIVPSVQVLVSKTAILVDNKKILDIDSKGVMSKDPNAAYTPLAQALDKRVETIKAIAARGGSPFNGDIMIIADEDTPYDLISNVLYQAGRAEFTQYRLVVRKK